MLISSVWTVLAPILAAQYILTVAGLIVLSRRDVPVKTYVLWNVFILLVFFIGSITFLIYNKVKPLPKK